MHWIRRGIGAHNFLLTLRYFRYTTSMLATQNVRIHRRPDFSFIAYALPRRLDRDMYKMIMALNGATISLCDHCTCCERSKQIEWIHLFAPVSSFRSLLR